MSCRLVKAVILAAGLGTRLRPLTDRVPKCLVPLVDRPLLDYWLDGLAAIGVRHVLLNTHAHVDQVRAHIAAINRRGGMHLEESYESQLLGSAGTIHANPGWAEEADEVIIIYVDNLSGVDLARMLEYHRSHADPMTMLLFHAPEPSSCGIADLDASGRVVGFQEKPQVPRSDLANAGVYIVDADAYRQIAAMSGFDFGFDVLPKFVGRMRGWTLSGYHRDIGTPQAYEAAQRPARWILDQRGFDQRGQRAAVFLDRDGTLIKQVHYLADPEEVQLIDGAGDALSRLRGAGFALVVVSNQSAVGRGMISETQLAMINERVSEMFSRNGVVFDAYYHCPHVPQTSDRTVIEHEDRKPGAGMLRRAAAELGLNLNDSWMIGDMISDVLAGVNAGCRGSVLIDSDDGSGPREMPGGCAYEAVAGFPAAARHILDQAGEAELMVETGPR